MRVCAQVSVAWQLPQWVLIAIAETTVAVTGLEFAFTQCGPNTRSLVQARDTDLANAVPLPPPRTGVPTPPPEHTPGMPGILCGVITALGVVVS